MAGEDNENGGVSFALPADVDDWIADAAERRDESRDEFCRRLLTAARAVAAAEDGVLEAEAEGEGGHGDGDGNGDAESGNEYAFDPVVRDDLEALQGELEASREEFRELLEDVRSRVVQVKRETDAKAPADHGHPEYAEAEALERLQVDLEALEETVDGGFDNFEEVLDYLLERTDRLEERSTVLATAVVDLRDRWDDLVERERQRAQVEDLKLAANRLGIRSAACEECDASVDLALLTAPECPHCASPFADVRERTSFFGSHTLETGSPPALEGRGSEVETTPEGVFEAVEADADGTDEDDERRGLGLGGGNE
ncbi:hypothetical protein CHINAEXTREME_12740 [Halobiforma lacisalsi AJ5]|uniref:CopG family transcriptional regulator n=1 Tax=Natronobacterium lacisalsi AJ5 TaxID=358396 RepID=M0LJ35_NATLA|nr:hypothetical protein [Halobiforma lacisalsi]APW98590.1 hypothetical protein CHINAEXTREME_12740 [Halobiforma lacisalsi AJ5]EMA32449.1 hypothetical protein C445_10047 [Halobiforma lacisalsi AJ5]